MIPAFTARHPGSDATERWLSSAGHPALEGRNIQLFMSQTAFAQELGVSYTTVNRWEMGRATPTYKTMKLIDDYCKEKGIEFDIHESLTQEK